MKAHEHEKNHSLIDAVDVWVQGYVDLYISIQNDILTLRRLMSYIYGAPILDVSRSHTTTQHSR